MCSPGFMYCAVLVPQSSVESGVHSTRSCSNDICLEQVSDVESLTRFDRECLQSVLEDLFPRLEESYLARNRQVVKVFRDPKGSKHPPVRGGRPGGIGNKANLDARKFLFETSERRASLRG